jgi:hypothetical protein
MLSELQGAQGKQPEDNGNNPKPHDDLGLGPALQFEMMVNGGHAKDAMTVRDLEIAHLKDD